ncbi:MAG: hypothetical protein K9M51_04235, partial [Candidatus Gracilibacteria bacterium]|nr:hypothetical protein [Candidatus Gracilibacteria bacterium]
MKFFFSRAQKTLESPTRWVFRETARSSVSPESAQDVLTQEQENLQTLGQTVEREKTPATFERFIQKNADRLASLQKDWQERGLPGTPQLLSAEPFEGYEYFTEEMENGGRHLKTRKALQGMEDWTLGPHKLFVFRSFDGLRKLAKIGGEYFFLETNDLSNDFLELDFEEQDPGTQHFFVDKSMQISEEEAMEFLEEFEKQLRAFRSQAA